MACSTLRWRGPNWWQYKPARRPIALVKNGDPITIDAEKRELTLEVPPPRYTRGVLTKYAAHVPNAFLGAVPDMELKLQLNTPMLCSIAHK